jgi:tetratricopeptide (TPR) repeat protein
MPKATPKSPLSVPQSSDTWYFAARKLRAWVAPEGEEPVRPYIMITLNLDQGIIQDIAIGAKPNYQAAHDHLNSAMLNSPKGVKIKPHRPARVLFEDKLLMQAIAPTLQLLDIDSRYQPQREMIDEIIEELQARMNDGSPETPGLLSQRQVSPNLVKGLFEAAADFYRSAPWIQINNDDVLSIQLLPKQDPYYAIVMGQGGVEYGLALYKRREDLERQYLPHDHPDEIIPPTGLHSLFFNDITEVPFDDLDALEKYNWEIAGQGAYPVPLVFLPSKIVQRPNRDELLWYEAALRAIPILVRDHIRRNTDGELQAVEVSIPVKTSVGRVIVKVKHPVGNIPRFKQYAYRDEDGADQSGYPFDRRAIEGDMFRMFGMQSHGENDSKPAKAQQLMYQAWEERNPAKRIALARKALKLSEACTDAYVLLAEEEASTVQEALEYYQAGVEAAKQVLDTDYFEENAGHFWGLLETRPYMRAMEGMASCLWQLGRKAEAVEIYWEMLRLNPGDNQGIRYVLVDLLLNMNRMSELDVLIKRYQNDISAVWLYTKALIAYRKKGAHPSSNRALKSALTENPHVYVYLSGKKRIPNRLPSFIGIGDEAEAVAYAACHLNYWRQTTGALEWMEQERKG